MEVWHHCACTRQVRLETIIYTPQERETLVQEVFPKLTRLLSASQEELRESAAKEEYALHLPTLIEAYLVTPVHLQSTYFLTLAYKDQQEQSIGLAGRILKGELATHGFVYVHPKARNQGIGLLLITTQFAHAKRRGARYARYLPYTQASRAIFEKLKETYPFSQGLFDLTRKEEEGDTR